MRVVLLAALASCALAHADAAVEDVDSSGWTALMRAAQSGQTDEIAALLDRGANIEASDPRVYRGATPLVIALEYGQHDAALLLLDRGASTAGARGTAALELAARGGLGDVIDRLLARKVAVRGTKALHLAAKYGYADAIVKLVRAGAKVRDPDRSDHDYTPLVIACQSNRLAAARALLAAGANANDVDADGTPALHWAVFGARPDEIHEYEELGGEHTTDYVPQKDAPLVRLLLAKGARRDAVDAGGNTALHEAAKLDARAAAAVLLAVGADRARKNARGETALDLARGNTVEPLLRAK
jgi:ankyrin repeat protein